MPNNLKTALATIEQLNPEDREKLQRHLEQRARTARVTERLRAAIAKGDDSRLLAEVVAGVVEAAELLAQTVIDGVRESGFGEAGG